LHVHGSRIAVGYIYVFDRAQSSLPLSGGHRCSRDVPP
jgi:hypothetical protein